MTATTLYRYDGTNATGGHVLWPVNGGDALVLGNQGNPGPVAPPTISHGSELPATSDLAEAMLGPSGPLTEYPSGDFTGAMGAVVIENATFTNKNIRVRAGANVTLRNCIIIGPAGSSSYTVRINEGGNARLLMENCIIVSRTTAGAGASGQNCITGWGDTSLCLRRCVIRGGIDGVHFHGKGPAIWPTGDPLIPMATFLMEECWIGDNERVEGSHSDLMQMAGARPNTITNYVWRRNRFMGYSLNIGDDTLTSRADPETSNMASACWIDSTDGGSRYAIRGNWFEGGNNMIHGHIGSPAPVELTGNLFAPKARYGATSSLNGWTNVENRWAYSGTLLNGVVCVGGALIPGSVAGDVPPPDPDPDPDPPVEPEDPDLPPPPPSWEAAVATGDIVQVVNWYETYTGHDGINPYDPDDLPIAEEDLIWVSGGIKSTHDGQVLEGLVSNHIRIAHNNVTVRRCRIMGGAGQGYGSYFNPTFGSTYHNTVIEFCTFEGNMTTSGNSGMLLSKTTDRRAVLFRHNESFGFQSMMRGESWVEIEYNYYHDAYHPPGVHSNGIRVIGGGARARRNLITDGTSGGMNMYINETHGDVWDAQYVENIIGGTIHMPGGRVISPEASASYAFTIGGDRGHLSHGIRIVGNMLYEGLQYGPFSGSGVRWGEDGNYRYDNVWFADGVAPNGQPVQAGQPAMTENRPPEN